MLVHFVTYGIAQPQGSKSAFIRKGKDGKPQAAMRDTSTGLDSWRAAVATAARDWQQEHNQPLLDEPLDCVLDFVFPAPQSKKNKQWKDTQPDWDKLARAVCDSMTGIIYRDDALIVAGTVYKRYDPSVPPQVNVWIRPAAVIYDESETV